jgi:hypothetical protein
VQLLDFKDGSIVRRYYDETEGEVLFDSLQAMIDAFLWIWEIRTRERKGFSTQKMLERKGFSTQKMIDFEEIFMQYSKRYGELVDLEI